MDKDNKNILLYRKIILLSLSLITCLRWYRVDIEKAITRLLKTCEFKGFFRMCRAKESHACLSGRFFSSYNCYQNNRIATLNLCTVIYNWTCNMGKHCPLCIPSAQSPGSHPWFLPHASFPCIINHQDLLIFPPSFLNSGTFFPLPCLCLSLDLHHFLTRTRTRSFTSISPALAQCTQEKEIAEWVASCCVLGPILGSEDPAGNRTHKICVCGFRLM